MKNEASSDAVERLLAAVRAWAERRDDVRGVALVGSHARGSARPGSDVDLVVLIRSPEEYVGDSSWAGGFGTVEDRAIERYGALTSVRVHYAAGPEVEFGFATPEWAAVPPDAGTAQVVAGGMRVLFEQDALLSRLRDACEGVEDR